MGAEDWPDLSPRYRHSRDLCRCTVKDLGVTALLAANVLTTWVSVELVQTQNTLEHLKPQNKHFSQKFVCWNNPFEEHISQCRTLRST
jgi:hypothetical protein